MSETTDVFAPDSVHSAVVDPTTLQLVYPAAALLYSGPCKLKDITSNSRGAPATAEGGNQLLQVVTKIDYPIGQVPDGGFPEGSLIVCTSSLRMPQMVGAEYLARQSILKAFAVQYTVLADRRKRTDP